MSVRKRVPIAVLGAAVAMSAAGAVSATAAAASPTVAHPPSRVAAANRPPGSFIAVGPARLLDTVTGLGARRARVTAGGVVDLQVTGRAGIPSPVAAVALNVTVSGPTRSGNVVLYPKGQARPDTPLASFVKGVPTSHAVIATVGAAGRVELANRSAGTVQLAVDVSGYYVAGAATAPGAYVPVTPTRFLDTRNGTGAPQQPLGGGTDVDVTVGGQAGVPRAGVSAVIVNLTATDAVAAGVLSATAVYAGRSETIDFRPGASTSNLAVVAVNATGQIQLANLPLGEDDPGGAVDVVGEVYGYFRAGTPATGGMFGYSGATSAPSPFVGAHRTVTVTIPDVGGPSEPALHAVLVNLTVFEPSGRGALTVYAHGAPRPKVSTLTFAHHTVDGFGIVRVGTSAMIDIHNGSGAAVHVEVAVAGYVGAFPGPAQWSVGGVIDTGSRITGISCASPSFCAASDLDGNALTYNGSTWSPPTAIGPSVVYGVSCGGTVCAAVDGSPTVYLYRHGSWTTAVPSTNSTDLQSTQCLSATFCVAVAKYTSSVYVYNGSSWHASSDPKMDPYGGLILSCATPTFCLGDDSNGHPAVFNGVTWIDTVAPPDPFLYDTYAISCITPTSCAVLSPEDAITFTGTKWISAHHFGLTGDQQMGSVTCGTVSFCVALGADSVWERSSAGWSPAQNIDSGAFLAQMSCAPGTTFCAAIDSYGRFVTTR